MINIYIGMDTTNNGQILAHDICKKSILRNLNAKNRNKVKIHSLIRSKLIEDGLYYRENDEKASTEFTYTRFLVPYLNNYKGIAVFCDSDFLWQCDIYEEFLPYVNEMLKEKLACMCVKHDYVETKSFKMDGLVQSHYPRKNWSSLIIFNCGHPEVMNLSVENVNTQEAKWLHRYEWCEDELIGELPKTYNYLVGIYDDIEEPKVIHYTNGGPWHYETRNCQFSENWHKYLSNKQGEILQKELERLKIEVGGQISPEGEQVPPSKPPFVKEGGLVPPSEPPFVEEEDEKIKEEIKEEVKREILKEEIKREIIKEEHKKKNIVVVNDEINVVTKFKFDKDEYEDFLEKELRNIEESSLDNQYFQLVNGVKKIYPRRKYYLMYYVLDNKHKFLNNGLWMEFGSGKADSLNILSKYTDKTIYGFMNMKNPNTKETIKGHPKVEKNVNIFMGEYVNKIDEFKKKYDGDIALLHIDCDTYEETIKVFDKLHDRIKDGCVIIFDELINYPGFEKEEMKAFYEYTQKYNISYEWVGTKNKVMYLSEYGKTKLKTFRQFRDAGYEQEVAVRIGGAKLPILS